MRFNYSVSFVDEAYHRLISRMYKRDECTYSFRYGDVRGQAVGEPDEPKTTVPLTEDPLSIGRPTGNPTARYIGELSRLTPLRGNYPDATIILMVGDPLTVWGPAPLNPPCGITCRNL